MKTSTTFDSTTAAAEAIPSTARIADFLAEYSSRLLGAGATCIRLEKNVDRIAAAYGMQAELYIMPRHINIAVHKEGETTATTTIATVRHNSISYNINTLLSQLSWEIADRKIGFDDALLRFREIFTLDSQNPYLVMVLVAFANASFCRLFGGDWVAMAIVWVATLAGYYTKIKLLEKKMDVRMVFLICSFISSVLGSTDTLFSIGTTPTIAVGTSVLYLVPGIPFLNSFSDILYRHYICALSRFMDALVLTCCLSAGLCAGMLMMNVGMF